MIKPRARALTLSLSGELGNPDAGERALGELELPPIEPGAAHPFSLRVTLPEVIADGRYALLVTLAEDPDEARPEDDWADVALRIDGDQACGVDPLEPNGSPFEEMAVSRAAASLEVGRYEELYACVGDDDWYRVQLAPEEALRATITFEHRDGDLDLALYESDQQTLISESRSLQDLEQVEYLRAREETELFLRVFLNSEGAELSSQYDLQIDIGPSEACADDGFEPNGSQEEASLLPDGQHELALCPGDEDWFRFPIPAGNTVSFQLIAGVGAVSMTLFDPTGAPVDESERRVVHEALLNGPYRLRVRPIDAEGPVAYALAVSGVSGVDLAAEQISLSAGEGGPGDELLVRSVIRNFRADSAEEVTLRYRLSLDERPSADDVVLADGLLAEVPGAGQVEATQRIRLPADLPPGPRRLLLEIDPARTLPDIRPGNNLISAPFEVLGQCVDDDPRLNEGPESATPLVNEDGPLVEGEREGVICPYSEDWYQLSAPAGALSVELSSAGARGGDLDLILLIPSLGVELRSEALDGEDTLSAQLPEEAEVLIGVDGFLAEQGGYTLSWESGR